MKILDALLGSVDPALLVVMAVSFVAVVWWGFRRKGQDGPDGGDVPGGTLFDDDADGGGDGD